MENIANIANKSALLEQYREIKKKYPDYLLLFTTGSFYMFFNEDAETASKILGLPLFEKPEKKLSKIVGFSHSSKMFYPFSKKLIRAGYKFAICIRLFKNIVFEY